MKFQSRVLTAAVLYFEFVLIFFPIFRMSANKKTKKMWDIFGMMAEIMWM